MTVPNIHITISDMRPLYCVKGVKKGFAEAGLDFAAFLENGAMSHDLLGHGYDAVIERTVRAKLEASDGR